ncbi:Ni/Fe-hydrogenase, b-type cytochrome subunit [Piscinibacter sakaiensis]|uniref:Ni,Fe-hydrogenase I, cytochrome b subunit n=1 Tax=Piscinibacter sakaiensis TaxID=1547922 RepID=A0A0K8P191_PISS1|nr:Ni/Fe-hydrogenase, b-type cytochrome subunit [Piscinibacter sakaiensis]GAP35940.1 Ni,Fe-hydrogenase I, cytochrome b subunit [Piscinibacter sakaiensis]
MPDPSRDVAARAAAGDLSALDQAELAAARTQRAVYVYEVPVRLWHWVNAGALLVLAVTGWLIASPPPTPVGEASAHFIMGSLRFAHFAAGWILAVGLAGRTYWAFAGNPYARELYWVPLFQLAYWKDLLAMLRWYGFLSARPGQYVGHNPLARFAMFFCFLLPCVFMVLTGFALYAEGQQAGSLFDHAFGWVIPLFGSSQDVHTAHHLGLWALLCFAMLHVYAALREEILGRSSMLSTMVSGWRTFKD